KQEIHMMDALDTQSVNSKERMIQLINENLRNAEKERKRKGQTDYPPKVSSGEGKVKEIPIEAVNVNELVQAKRLSTEEEVDTYANTLSRQLKDSTKSNKHIDIRK